MRLTGGRAEYLIFYVVCGSRCGRRAYRRGGDAVGRGALPAGPSGYRGRRMHRPRGPPTMDEQEHRPRGRAGH